MKGSLKQFILSGRQCACLIPKAAVGPFPLCTLCGWELAEQLASLGAELPDMLLFWAEMDGAHDCTPWPAPPVWDTECYDGGAPQFLEFLEREALPFLEGEFGASPEPARHGLLGYSLGGLFALWALGESDRFQVFGSLSGSTWYDGLTEYLRSWQFTGREHVYLSLGDREEFGGPPRIRTVGRCTREIYDLLAQKLPDVQLEWNRGGHGKGVQNRWKRALAWAARRITPCEGGNFS